MDIGDRFKRVIAEIFEACDTDEQGRARVDSGRVTAVVRRDPEAVAFALQKILASPLADRAGWSGWMVTAQAFEKEYGDDSLVVLVEAAAAAAGKKLPRVLSSNPIQPEQREKFVELEMAEADVAAGDAHRMLMVMRLDGLSAELRTRLLGRCIMTFPADGDDRPVQHIPRIRAFVADLHKRMPYFPIFLNFDQTLCMHMVYFGSLADIEATEVRPDGSVRTNMVHPSVLAATKAALTGIRRACTPLNIDWKPHAEAILAPYDPQMRGALLSER